MIDLKGHKKGQYFSFDAIIASVIFILTLIMLLSYWYSVKTYLDFQANDLNKEATRISTLLFMPPDGSCTDMKRLGLANDWTDKRMNTSLLDCIKGMGADDLKSNLSAAYDVYIVVTDITDPGIEFKLGVDPATLKDQDEPSEISKFTRIGTLTDVKGTGKDHMAKVELYVYR